jgi:hypothetical protein
MEQVVRINLKLPADLRGRAQGLAGRCARALKNLIVSLLTCELDAEPAVPRPPA